MTAPPSISRSLCAGRKEIAMGFIIFGIIIIGIIRFIQSMDDWI